MLIIETRDTCLFDEVSRLYDAGIKAEVDEVIWLMSELDERVFIIMVYIK